MSLFVCDLCNTIDSVEVAYPSRDFVTKGPPKPWRCTQCQGYPWHDFFPKTNYNIDDEEISDLFIVNRVSQHNPQIGLG